MTVLDFSQQVADFEGEDYETITTVEAWTVSGRLGNVLFARLNVCSNKWGNQMGCGRWYFKPADGSNDMMHEAFTTEAEAIALAVKYAKHTVTEKARELRWAQESLDRAVRDCNELKDRLSYLATSAEPS